MRRALWIAIGIAWIASEAGAVVPRRLSWLPFKGARVCSDAYPCFQITPDAKGVILLNPQRQLYYIEAATGIQTRIGDGNCYNQDCFSVSSDSRSVAFIREEGDEMAVFLAALPGSTSFVVDAPARRLGLLPRFAGTKPGVAEYELKFCGAADTLFVRAGKPGGTGGVHAFVGSEKGTPRRDVFFEKGGKTGKLLCSPAEQSAYFLAHRFTDDGAHHELVMKASAARLRAGDHGAEVLFRQESDIGDQMIGPVRAMANELGFVMKTPSWDPYPMSALMFKGAADEGVRPLLQLSDSQIEELLAWRGDSLVFSSHERGGFVLGAQPKHGGERVRLTQAKFGLEPGSIVSSGNHGRVLFAEQYRAERHWIVADVKGASRRLLWSSPPNPPSTDPPDPNPPPPGPPTLPIPGKGPAENRTPLTAKLTASGKCAIVKSQSRDGAGPARAESAEIETGTVIDLLPGVQSKTAIGGFEMAPDSSFVVMIADREKAGEHYLYLTPTPGCR